MFCGLRRLVKPALWRGLAHNTGAGSIPSLRYFDSLLHEKQGQDRLAMLVFGRMEDLIPSLEDSTPHSCKLIVKELALVECGPLFALAVVIAQAFLDGQLHKKGIVS